MSSGDLPAYWCETSSRCAVAWSTWMWKDYARWSNSRSQSKVSGSFMLDLTVYVGTRLSFHQCFRAFYCIRHVRRVRENTQRHLRRGGCRHPSSLSASYLKFWRLETGTLHPLYRRDRCHHWKARERSARDGKTHSCSITDLHGWSVPRSQIE